MDREGTEGALHQLLLEAIARGARAHEHAEIVHERHRAVHEAVRETMEAIRRRRMRAAGSPPESNGM